MTKIESTYYIQNIRYLKKLQLNGLQSVLVECEGGYDPIYCVKEPTSSCLTI